MKRQWLTEEALGSLAGVGNASKGPETDVELGDQDEDDEPRSDVTSVDTSDGGEGELLDRVTLDLPRSSESDVGDADGQPGEQCGETRQGDEPVEHGATDIGKVDVGDGAKDEDGNQRPERSTGLVDVGEDARGVTGLGEGGEGSGTGVHAGETDREDGDADGGVDQVVKTVDTGPSDDNDKGGDLEQGQRKAGRADGIVATHISAGSAKQVRVVVRDGETDDGERGDVNQGDSPEGVLDSRRERLSRVGSLSGGKPHELGTGLSG